MRPVNVKNLVNEAVKHAGRVLGYADLRINFRITTCTCRARCSNSTRPRQLSGITPPERPPGRPEASGPSSPDRLPKFTANTWPSSAARRRALPPPFTCPDSKTKIRHETPALICIVDDDPRVGASFRLVLQAVGHHVAAYVSSEGFSKNSAMPSGNTIYSAGFPLGVNTSFQKGKDLPADSVDVFLKDWIKVSQGQGDEKLARVVCENADGMLEWMHEFCAVNFAAGSKLVWPMLSRAHHVNGETKPAAVISPRPFASRPRPRRRGPA